MTPAHNIIKKCGGVAATAKITERTESVVYRWTYPVEKGGTGGSIPKKAQTKLLAASARGEIDIRPEDFFVSVYHAQSAGVSP